MEQKVVQMGFQPIFNKDSKVLILGSFPSVVSRQNDFYYANKHNRFWITLQNVFGGKIDTVHDKTQLCLSNGIALWDIVSSCSIVGSLDVNIKNPTLVDLSVILDNANIQAILCNGQTAYNFTKKAYCGNVPVELLPSTSPANTRFDKNVWQQKLKLYTGSAS